MPISGNFEWTKIEENGKNRRRPHFIQDGSEVLVAVGFYAARKVEDDWPTFTAVITRGLVTTLVMLSNIQSSAFLTPYRRITNREWSPTLEVDGQSSGKMSCQV